MNSVTLLVLLGILLQICVTSVIGRCMNPGKCQQNSDCCHPYVCDTDISKCVVCIPNGHSSAPINRCCSNHMNGILRCCDPGGGPCSPDICCSGRCTFIPAPGHKFTAVCDKL